MRKEHLLLLSLDSLSEADLYKLMLMPNFSRLLKEGTLVKEVNSIFLTNTYVVHSSIITGALPKHHGILDNLVKDPGNPKPDWHWFRKDIQTTTLYDEAAKEGHKVASILWPVTAKGKIHWNMPEIFPNKPMGNQMLLSLKNGSFWFQLLGFLRYGRKVTGKKQPELDNFTTLFMENTLRTKKPNLALLHLIDTDTQKHRYGLGDKRTKASIERMDKRLGRLVEAMRKIDKNYSLILFSDHGSLEVMQSMDPNQILRDLGIKTPRKKGDSWEAWFKPCGGSGFLYLQPGQEGQLQKIKEKIQTLIEEKECGIRRFLTLEEMESSGFSKEATLGIEASLGTEFHDDGRSFKANHGYSLQNPGYKVFYYVKGPGIREGKILTGGSLLDIAPLAAHQLGIPKWKMTGQLKEEIITKEQRHGKTH